MTEDEKNLKEKGYRSLDSEMKRRFGTKVYKISLDAGTTCPNRDGKCGYGGCIFCADEAYAVSALSIAEQLKAAKEKVSAKIKNGKYIAYFQSHTNTYGDLERLEKMFAEAMEDPEVVALSLGTRPDCIGDDVTEMLTRLNKKKPVWVELGLQTIHERTAELINRCYSLFVFEEAYAKLKAAGLEVIVHVIIGLPGESKEDVRKTVRYLADLEPRLDGIKLQLLHVLKGTRLYEMYTENPDIIHHFSMEEYVDFVAELVAMLPKETVVHRLTGDGPRKLLAEPLWTTDKKRVMNEMRKRLK
ncbi:MAG: TIGR01212 family radical SAM protein [Lachnospiraceae bacterium]|nr:TIGR01212 family radical SAM protein [Lachnospiraceae bacterium]